MNWQHFRAFLWLRWRIRANQLKRGGVANTVLLMLLAALVGVLAVGLFAIFFLVGLFALPKAPPVVLLYVWDGLVVAFLFCWGIGLLADLQRPEALSLDKFLHLPVSLRGAFLINYAGSLVSVTLILFLPPMLALCLALVFAKGLAMLLQLPVLAAFLFMVTAVTYQFQGWLASLMVNQRRRRTVIVLVSAGFILLLQSPQLVHFIRPWEDPSAEQAAASLLAEQTELQRSLSAGTIKTDEFVQRHNAMQSAQRAKDEESKQRAFQQVERFIRLVNLVTPPGWLPLGAMAAAEGAALPSLLGTLGLTLIGSASLWRAYRTTLRLYTGQFSAGKRRAAAVPRPSKTGKRSTPLLEQDLPWVHEQAAAVALGSFRSLVRAHEVKILCLGPVIMAIVFGGIFASQRIEPPEWLRPLIAFGAVALALLCTVQLVGNQFGFDRTGFRAFVLSPVRRSDILLGKNLAFAPLALGMGLVLVLLLQLVAPMRWDHFLAVWPQALSSYLVFCVLANLLSIYGPMPIAPGTLRPVSHKLMPVVLQLAFALVFPLTLVPVLLPLGAQLVLEALGWIEGLPVGLVLSLAMCAAVVYLYRLILNWQGDLLQAREQKILGIVTSKE